MSSDKDSRSRHLANAGKYLSSVPVILFGSFINTLQAQYEWEGTKKNHELKSRIDLAINIW